MNTLVNPVSAINQSNSILITQATRPSRPDVSHSFQPHSSFPRKREPRNLTKGQYQATISISKGFWILAFAGITGKRQPCHLNTWGLRVVTGYPIILHRSQGETHISVEQN